MLQDNIGGEAPLSLSLSLSSLAQRLPVLFCQPAPGRAVGRVAWHVHTNASSVALSQQQGVRAAPCAQTCLRTVSDMRMLRRHAVGDGGRRPGRIH